jgi:hypothetical protein
MAAPVYKTDITAVAIRHADHMASGSHSVGIVRSQTQAEKFRFFSFFFVERRVVRKTVEAATFVQPGMCISGVLI